MSIYVKIEEIISKILIVAVVMLVFMAALGRWVGYPMPLAVDLGQLLFIWVCFLGANQALRRNKHLGIEILHDRFPAWLQAGLALVFAVLSVGFLCFLLVKGIELTNMNKERTFSDSALSYSYVTMAVPVGSALLMITFLRKLTLQVLGRPDPYVVSAPVMEPPK